MTVVVRGRIVGKVRRGEVEDGKLWEGWGREEEVTWIVWKGKVFFLDCLLCNRRNLIQNLKNGKEIFRHIDYLKGVISTS